jgi:3',5'-cyclic AMP phosphodiesterase CpdA
MLDLLESSSGWREVAGLIENRKSAVVIAPRSYGKWSLLQKYAKQYSADSKLRCLVVSSRIPSLEGDIEYSWLWDLVRSQLAWRRRIKVTTCSSFLSAFAAILSETTYHIMVFIGGAGRGHEETHYRVLSTFQRMLGTGRLTVVGTDDYSSFYYQKQNYLLSDLHSLFQVHIGPITHGEIKACITDALQGRRPDDYVTTTAENIHRRSGGHLGLAEELLLSLERESWPPLGPLWDSCVEGSVRRSVVLESISRALEEDAVGYSRTAVEYRLPACPEQNSPRIHILRQLGVLQREDPPLVRLCGGAITKLIEGLQRGPTTGSPGRIGTIVSEAGPRLFQDGPVELRDDDLVVLHLSDLHVGELHYKHRLTWPGGQLNPNEQSAGELIREDLQSLELSGRIDAMVLSGDLVCSGSPNEFRRAQSVIEELLLEMNLDLSRLLLVPGNHDIEWNPGSLGVANYGKPVSREGYDDFLKLLGKAPQGEIDVVEVTSRSNTVKLQLVGLDSNRVEGPQAAGIGFVSRDALVAAKKAVQEFRSNVPSDTQALNWIVVHHHIFPATPTPLSEAEGRVVSIMANSAEILDYANQWKVEVILHGHEHQPSITVARRWPIDVGDVFAPIASIGAGSFSVKRDSLGPFSRNHYYVLVRRADGLLIRSRQQGTGGVKFVSHSDMWLPR